MLHLQPQHKVHRDRIPVQSLREILLIFPIDTITGLDAAIDVEVQHRPHFKASEQPFLVWVIAISKRHGQTKHLDAREIRIAALRIGHHYNLSVGLLHKTDNYASRVRNQY